MSPRPATITRMALAVVVAAGLGIFWKWEYDAERRALLKLSPVEREEVYHRELATFRTLCIIQAREQAWEEGCRQRADFIRRFPECDSLCQALVQNALPAPAR